MTDWSSIKKLFLVSSLGLLLNTSGCVLEVFQSESSLISPLAIAKAEEEQSSQINVEGEKGNYVAELEVEGSLEKAWEVLTDYDNFENFIPNTVNSKIIEENGNNLVFQQTNSIDLILLTQEFVVQIAATKMPRQKIDFQMIEGDLGSLTGSWQIEQFSDRQVRIIHRVNVTPKSQGEALIFYPIYENSLEETLEAIAEEITKRSKT